MTPTQREKDEKAAEEYAMNRPSSDCSESLHLGCLEREAFLAGIAHARKEPLKYKNTACDATCSNYSDEDTVAEVQALTARCEKLEAVLKHISSDEVSCPLCRAGALDMADHYAGIAKEAIEAVEEVR